MRSRAGDVIKTIQVKDLISSSTERYGYYTDITVFCNLRAGYEVESSKTLNFSNTILTLVSAIIYLFQFPPSDDQGGFFVCLVFVFFFFFHLIHQQLYFQVKFPIFSNPIFWCLNFHNTEKRRISLDLPVFSNQAT